MSRLRRLLASNKTRPNRRFEVVNTLGEAPVIYLYDAIVDTEVDVEWYGGVAADTFVKTLVGIKAEEIHIRINSPGGSVFAARAMEMAVRQHRAKIVMHIDGYAASAASYFALAGDEIEIHPGGFFMIHKAWTYAAGNADELAAEVELLKKIDDSLADSYAAKTGQDKEQIIAWMAAETWFNAAESVNLGFAGKVAESGAKNTATWDLSAYDHAPIARVEADPPPSEAPDFRDDMSRKAALIARAF